MSDSVIRRPFSERADQGRRRRSGVAVAKPTPAPPRRDVLFAFFYVSWQAAGERGWFMPEDRLARALVTHERVERLLVVDLMRSLPARTMRDLTERASRRLVAFPSDPVTQLARPVRLRRRDPSSLAGVRRTYAAFDKLLERRARSMGLREPVVITANPLMAGFCEFAWAGPVTYYATDDWLAHPLHRPWYQAYESSFEQLRQRNRHVCAVTTAALERVAPTGAGVVVPNGLDPEEWRENPQPVPGWADGLQRPLLIYVGTLDSRLDVPGLLALGEAMPQATILLIGPMLDAEHLAPLAGAPNVEIRPPVGRAEITSLIRSADVGLIPHVDSALTRAMSPLKLYEYLAGGVPVVATDLAPMRGVHGSVGLVSPDGGYAGAVGAALERGRASEAERLRTIAEHSWQARHEDLLDFAFA
jgi:teichuronic acid biosynthesis glycosyltransferase TuaH